MNRNTESHFGTLPSKNIRRSKFYMPCRHQFTFNTGDLVPFYNEEVLPGDTLHMKTSSLLRMLTPIDPVMDNAWMDTFYFYIPFRLLWEHWEEFMGENKTDYWTQKTDYTIPQLVAPEGGWDEKSIAHFLGARMNTSGIKISALYTRAYALIYNEWFRNENLMEPAEISTGDEDTQGNNGDDYVTDIQCGGHFAKAGKFADYFTRGLPSPQKGPDIYIPFGSTMAPIITSETEIPETLRPDVYLMMRPTTEATFTPNSRSPMYLKADGTGETAGVGYVQDSTTAGLTHGVYPTNLFADMSNATGGATINQLRQAFAIQRLYEVDARGGTRYIESILAHFGVASPDARHQRPEYIGGTRTPINMTQIVQTSETTETSPQGNTAAMSLTIDSKDSFTKSFTEHGIVMGLCVVRTEHTYQQGIPKRLLRKNRFDFYYPELANIGELPIKNAEIYAQGTDEDNEIFAYQESWAEYRYGINRISGELNSDYAQALDSWHYGDDYDQLPTLSAEWERETDRNMARTLAIQNQAQFKADFYFDQTFTRPMPVFSVPSLTGWM